MMNVLYLLTQPVAPPRGHHQQWTRALPHKLEEGCHATNTFWSRVHRVILLQNYFTIRLASSPILHFD